MSTVIDARSCIPIDTTRTGYWRYEMDMMAPRLLSRRETRKDLWALLQHACYLYYVNLHSSNAARCFKMLVFDRLGFPFSSGISVVQSKDIAPFL